MILIGKILGNRYEILEKIGGGGMALVYKAKCRLLNRFVAIKILRSEFTHDEEFINKFRRESQAAASLSHPNIVNIYDVGVEENTHYIVMEYINGRTLKHLIREKGSLDIEETLNISIQIAHALNHAHNNHIVHRDIKPHNILITEDARAKVTDFGIARAATSSTVTNTSSVIGSVHYFSPEQAKGGFTDEKSDIYSLGIVMYEMLTGRVPFQGDSPISVALKHLQEDVLSPREINENIPKNLEDIIMKCVKKDQSLRYSNATELLKDLNKAKTNKEEDFVELTSFNDSPTRVIPAIKDEDIMNKKEKKKSINKKKNSGKKLITIAAIISAILLTGVIGVGAIYVKFNDFLTVAEVEVPNVKGNYVDVAKEKIEGSGLKFGIRDEVYSSEFKEGYVVEQSVNPGDKRKVNNLIEVIVSKGEKIINVPTFEGKYASDIEMLLDNTELEKGKIDYQDNEIPRGIIINQNPKAGSEVPSGTKVDFVVSNGPKIEKYVMPNLKNTSLSNAQRELAALDLVLGNITYENSDEIEKDYVVGQSVKSGEIVEENTTIDLIVSLGPKEDEVKPEDEETTSNLEDTPNKEEGSYQLAITLPKDEEEVEVKVEKIQDGNVNLIYNKIHKTSEGTIGIQVTGRGKAKLKVYYDGKEVETLDIDFEEEQ